jgi:hypothetical protein
LIIGDIYASGCNLSQRTHTEIHPVAGPSFLLDAQDREAGQRFRERWPDPAESFFLPELVRYQDDQRCSHVDELGAFLEQLLRVGKGLV